MLMACILCSNCLMAQHCSIPKILREPDLPTEWMENNLNLREDQVGAIELVNLKYATQLDSVSSCHADRFTKFEKAHQVMWARDNELKFILTEEQFIAYNEAKEWKYPFISASQ